MECSIVERGDPARLDTDTRSEGCTKVCATQGCGIILEPV
jgi:hypothetical protein